MTNPDRKKPKLGKPVKSKITKQELTEGYKLGATTFDQSNYSHRQNRDFSGTAAPRVGGTSKPNPTAHKLSGTSSKKSIRKSIKNIKNTAASPQAKRSAIASYKKK